jgi:hypothetical protein
MRLVLESDLLDQAERLLTELKAIEQGNTAYWRNHDPDVCERGYSSSRQVQRILSHLLNIFSLLGNEKESVNRHEIDKDKPQREVAGGLGADRCGDERVSFAYDQTGCMNLSPRQNIGHRASISDGAGSQS